MSIQPDLRTSFPERTKPGDASLPARLPELRLGRWWDVEEETRGVDAGDLVRFVAPYLHEAVRREEYEQLLRVASICWVYAAAGAVRRVELVRALGQGGMMPARRAEVLAFLNGMAARHRRMFTDRHEVGRTPRLVAKFATGGCAGPVPAAGGRR